MEEHKCKCGYQASDQADLDKHMQEAHGGGSMGGEGGDQSQGGGEEKQSS